MNPLALAAMTNPVIRSTHQMPIWKSPVDVDESEGFV